MTRTLLLIVAFLVIAACDSSPKPTHEPVIIRPEGPPRANCPPSDPRNGLVFPCPRGGVVQPDTVRR